MKILQRISETELLAADGTSPWKSCCSGSTHKMVSILLIALESLSLSAVLSFVSALSN